MSGAKVAVVGGGGARTPLLIHGLAREQTLNIAQIALFDVDNASAQIMAALGREIVMAAGAEIEITTPARVEEAIEGAQFVLSSIRVGGIGARADDERTINQCGLVGQETTGAGGLAMALRTVPIALQHARLVEQLAPDAWLINFTNPAGLITQALRTHSRANVIGICDTPAELFHRIAWSLGLPFEDMSFEYSGLNHLGWVRRVLLRGEDITPRLLADDQALSRVYAARLFEPELIRTLGLIPSEYLFFYYGRDRAYKNQHTAGATRGEEIRIMNGRLFAELKSAVANGNAAAGVQTYKNYLNARNASYLRLEAHAESALDQGTHEWDPFEGATGYHKIALDVMTGLMSREAKRVVVNVRNGSSIPDLAPDDIVEVPSAIDVNGAAPFACGLLPEPVRGLVQSVKAYERIAIEAAVTGSLDLARLALLVYPAVGDWDLAVGVLDALAKRDPEHLGYLQRK